MTASRTDANYQDTLKSLAILAMILDHLGLYYFPEITLFRIIGRISMPIFCFFAGYNFHGAPKTRIITFGLILYAYTTYLFKQYTTPNILISIYLGQWYIYVFRMKLQKFFYEGYAHVIILAILSTITGALTDYGTLAMAIMVLGYIAKHDIPNLKLTAGISLIFSSLHTITQFNNFTTNDVALTIILECIGYVLMVSRNFNQKIIINLKLLSRYSIHIYVVHLVIIQTVYRVLYWDL